MVWSLLAFLNGMSSLLLPVRIKGKALSNPQLKCYEVALQTGWDQGVLRVAKGLENFLLVKKKTS